MKRQPPLALQRPAIERTGHADPFHPDIWRSGAGDKNVVRAVQQHLDRQLVDNGRAIRIDAASAGSATP